MRKRESEHEDVRETMIREFVIACNVQDPKRAKSLLRRMNAIEYLIAIDRWRQGDPKRPLPWFLRDSATG